MVDILAVISGKTFYACRYCGRGLFWDDETGFAEWNFCPYCGEPLEGELR